MLVKRFSSVLLLCFCLILSRPFSAVADIRSNIVSETPANAVMAWSLKSGASIMPFSDEGGEGNDIYASLYNASTGKFVRNIFPSIVNGVYKFPTPQNGCYYRYLVYRTTSAKAGTYNAVWTFKEVNTVFNIQYVNGYMKRNNGFASDTISKKGNFKKVTDSTGDVYTATCNFVVPYDIANFAVEIRIDETAAFDFKSVSFKINYGLSSSATDVSQFPTDSSGNASDVIINQNNQLVNASNSIFESLQELIQHISNQLAALWDQMYNLIQVPTMAKLDEILSALRAIANNSDIYAVVEEIDSSSREQTSQIVQNANENTTKVEQAVEKHGNFIIEGLKGLFIPSNEYFSTVFNDLNGFFKDKFGFLYTPVDLLIRFINLFSSANAEFTGIPFPELSWDGHVLLEAQTVQFDILQLDAFKDVQQKLYFLTDLMMIGALLALIHKKFEEVMQN